MFPIMEKIPHRGQSATGIGKHNRKSRDWARMSLAEKLAFAPKTDGEAYELVLSFFYVDGRRHGAKSALGRALNCTRATVDMWEKNGFPLKYHKELVKLTGLRPRHIYPGWAALLD